MTCVERPRSSSVSRLAQADLLQCGADPGIKLSPGLPSVRLSRLWRFDTDGRLISWSDACRSSRAGARSLMSIGRRNAVEAERRRAASRPRSGGHPFRASRTIRRKSSSSL